MALFYVVGCIVILCANYDFLLPALKAIFVLAFKPGAVTGGLVGSVVRDISNAGRSRKETYVSFFDNQKVFLRPGLPK